MAKLDKPAVAMGVDAARALIAARRAAPAVQAAKAELRSKMAQRQRLAREIDRIGAAMRTRGKLAPGLAQRLARARAELDAADLAIFALRQQWRSAPLFSNPNP